MAKRKRKNNLSDDNWWGCEISDRPDGNQNRSILGNTIKLHEPENPKETLFKVNNCRVLIECIRTLAKRFKKKERTYVVFISEEQYHLFSNKGLDNES